MTEHDRKQDAPGFNSDDKTTGDWDDKTTGDLDAESDSVFARGYGQLRAIVSKASPLSIVAGILLVAVYFLQEPSHPEGDANIDGLFLTSQGRLDEAIATFDKSIKLAPTWYQPYMNRGKAYRLKGDYDRALADLNKSIELKSNYAESHYDRGLVWLDKGGEASAMADFEEAARLDPDGAVGAEAHVERAKIFRRDKSFESAVAELDGAIKHQAKPSWLLERARLNLLDLDRPAQAADDYAGAAREAIKYREWAHMFDQAYPQDKTRQQPDMMDYQVLFNPGGYYALLWAHFARVHANQDDAAEMAELARALALQYSNPLAVLDSKINDEALTRALAPWPGPIYLMFLGKTTPEALRQTVADGATDTARARRQCDVDFYLAVAAMQKHDEAQALLQAAVAGCPADSMEAAFAKVELKRSGS